MPRQKPSRTLSPQITISALADPDPEAGITLPFTILDGPDKGRTAQVWLSRATLEAYAGLAQ